MMWRSKLMFGNFHIDPVEFNRILISPDQPRPLTLKLIHCSALFSLLIKIFVRFIIL